MKIKAIKTRVFKEGEDLEKFILRYIPKLPPRSILVVTSKIVALSEGRTAVFRNKKTKIDLIKSESQWAMHTKHAWLTIKDGVVMASAGVDASNGDGKLILLPRDSFASAEHLLKTLRKKFKANLRGVIITDSRTIPLRSGVLGLALGYAGFSGIRDYRGRADIFGRKLRVTRTDVADSLAAAAVLLMGEGAERSPLAIIEGAPTELKAKIDKRELQIPLQEDLYGPLFRHLKKRKL